MQSTTVPTKNLLGMDLFGYSGWLTNRTTGRAFRPDDSDLVSVRERRKLPPRFDRESRWEWIIRQTAAAAQLNTPGSKAAQLVRHHGTRGLYLYTLSAWELGVTDPERIAWLEAPENYNNPATTEAWQRLLSAAFPDSPFKSCLHCGRNDRVAPHVIAGAEHAIPNPTFDRYTERRKHVQDTFVDRRRVFAYLCSKSYATPRQVKAFKRAVATAGSVHNLPQHSGYANMGFVRPIENAVTDTVYRKVHRAMGFSESMPQTTPLERFEPWLSGAFGAFTRSGNDFGQAPAREQP